MRFAEALALMFICLKLIDKIDWSWWWVLSPLWISLIALVIFDSSDKEGKK